MDSCNLTVNCLIILEISQHRKFNFFFIKLFGDKKYVKN